MSNQAGPADIRALFDFTAQRATMPCTQGSGAAIIKQILLCCLSILATVALAWSPAAAQARSDDRRSIAEWEKTANSAEALLQLPAAQRSRVSIDQWEDIRLDLTVHRELALALGGRGTLEGRIAKAQLAELDAASPASAGEPTWARQKREQLNRRLSADEAPDIAARDIEARNGVLIK